MRCAPRLRSPLAQKKRLVYNFNAEDPDGDASLRALLGGKGANLHEMSRIGLPVPPGFTITTESCVEYLRNGQWPGDLKAEVQSCLSLLERITNRKFGAGTPPLLVSVRSGAMHSMPGMMDTVLNLGLNDTNVAALADASGSERFALDSYRRLISMYANVVVGAPMHAFESALVNAKEAAGVRHDSELSPAALRGVVGDMLRAYTSACGEQFPTDPMVQLYAAIEAVFKSWDNERARAYRRIHHLRDDSGTAVNVQSMVYGNFNENSATGVAFTRNPATGERQFFGEYLRCAQGEDVVAGLRTPAPLAQLATTFPSQYKILTDAFSTLEQHYRDIQDVEFTIEDGNVFVLQTRNAKRTGRAAVAAAVDMLNERLITRAEALLRIPPAALEQFLLPVFQEGAVSAAAPVGTGLPAGPGAASGRVALSSKEAEDLTAAGEGPVVLMRTDTSPDDIKGMAAAAAIVTVRGGMTSHAAVVARQLGTVAVVGCEQLRIDEEAGTVKRADGAIVCRRGDWVSVDGSTGRVVLGRVATLPSQVLQVFRGEVAAEDAHEFQLFARVMRWADQERRMSVRANADSAEQLRLATFLGAEGIGLTRTEHMFFEGDRVAVMRRLILARRDEERDSALAELAEMQKGDFAAILRVAGSRPVNVRLLDPPLHEFLPHTEAEIAALAESLAIPLDDVRARVDALCEKGPMMGCRGVRLGVISDGLTNMQATALFEAAKAVVAEGAIAPHIEIMIPLVTAASEVADQAAIVHAAAAACGYDGQYKVGTMIETPRACLLARDIAERGAQFFSFGTNDLTQATYLMSRDDAGRFLPLYLERRIFPADPFAKLDVEGVGQLMRMAVTGGRAGHPGLHAGICGEHGGDADSIEFCETIGLDYVSCSPFRVPVARLAAAQAAIRAREVSAAKVASTKTMDSAV